MRSSMRVKRLVIKWNLLYQEFANVQDLCGITKSSFLLICTGDTLAQRRTQYHGLIAGLYCPAGHFGGGTIWHATPEMVSQMPPPDVLRLLEKRWQLSTGNPFSLLRNVRRIRCQWKMFIVCFIASLIPLRLHCPSGWLVAVSQSTNWYFAKRDGFRSEMLGLEKETACHRLFRP